MEILLVVVLLIGIYQIMKEEDQRPLPLFTYERWKKEKYQND